MFVTMFAIYLALLSILTTIILIIIGVSKLSRYRREKSKIQLVMSVFLLFVSAATLFIFPLSCLVTLPVLTSVVLIGIVHKYITYKKYPVIAAVRKYYPNEKVSALLEKHDINKTDNTGKTALMWACNTGSSKISGHVNRGLIMLLLEHGADVKIKDNKGLTALDYFRQREISSGESKEIEALIFEKEKQG